MAASDKRSTPRSSARIYREAARLLERRGASIWNKDQITYACEAIDTVQGVNSHATCEACQAMRAVFADDLERQVWLAGISSDDGDEEKDIEGRVLALCFMAAMVETGDA